MTPVAANRGGILDWAARSRAYHPGDECGDAHVVVPFGQGVLLGVIDGLGHGSEAAAAARAATVALARYAALPITDIIQQCHRELKQTRGAVISLARFDAPSATMTWVGVGNVEGALYRAPAAAESHPGPKRESLLLRGGVVGYQLPPLRAATLAVAPGDTLLLATDGISARFSDTPPLGRDPQEIADDILRRFAKSSDDALILAARYLGPAA